MTRRVRDFADVLKAKIVDAALADQALQRLDVDASGLDGMDRRYITVIIENYGGGPVGIDTLAAILSEQRDVIEDVIEPYLLQQGFVQRTPRGRLLTHKAYKHLGLENIMPRTQQNDDLFGA